MEPIKIITELMNASLQIYITYLFCSVFWDVKYKASVRFLVSAIISLFFTTTLLLFKGTLYSVFFADLFCFLITLLFKSKIYQKLIFSSIVFVVTGMIENIVAICLTLGFNNDFNAGKEGLLYISGIILSKFVMFLVYLIIRMKKHSSLSGIYKKNYIYLFIFPVSSFMIMTLQYKIFVDNPDQDRFMYISVIVIYTLLILANMIIFEFIDSLYKNTVNESRVSAANEIIENQRSQYEALIEHNHDILKIEHDNKNFCIGLISDLKEQRYDEIMEKLSEAHKLSLERERLTGNIISIIANIKSKEAALKNIQIDCEYNGSNKINIPATDVAIIIGNALDNAIEACEAVESDCEKRIDMLVKQRNDNVIIIIKNPTTAVNVEELETKKRNAKYHGFGIVSMKQIAEKYNGEVMMSCEEGIFTTSIVMNNKNDDE